MSEGGQRAGTTREHDLKCLPHPFEKQHSGEKNFEARWNDRDYRVGDVLRLREFTLQGGYTGAELRREVTYILAGPAFGVEAGWAILSTRPLSSGEAARSAPHPEEEGE